MYLERAVAQTPRGGRQRGSLDYFMLTIEYNTMDRTQYKTMGLLLRRRFNNNYLC